MPTNKNLNKNDKGKNVNIGKKFLIERRATIYWTLNISIVIDEKSEAYRHNVIKIRYYINKKILKTKKQKN